MYKRNTVIFYVYRMRRIRLENVGEYKENKGEQRG